MALATTERNRHLDRQSALSYLEPLENRSRNVAVLDALAEMVERAGLGIGDRLPPEISLAASLGVGRSTIREALNRWEASASFAAAAAMAPISPPGCRPRAALCPHGPPRRRGLAAPHGNPPHARK